ncbi:MAG TPA: LCP family protein [Acidimicrobiia bacterium]|jgi:LCP family protein required for cell wall assembly|nr:LCP family protein [Acidimicrobiia bacterium]
MNAQVGTRAFFHRLRTAAIAALLCAVVAIGGTYAIAAHKVAQVPTVKIDTSVLEPGGNYLLIGSDSRAFVDSASDAQHFGSAQAESGQRSDTIMIAHVDKNAGSGFLVSFPRDLWVNIPGIGHAKINAAFNAGPQRLIETIEQEFGVPISHYLQVDFAGFRKMVNAIGSIPISFPTPARDVKSGLYIDRAGCQHLNGDQALAYVRSRYYESFTKGQWITDPRSDLGRIQRQQYFLRTLASQVLHTTTHAPWRAPKLVDAMLANLQRDPTLGLSALRSLAYAFHGGSANIETLTLPASPQTIEGQDALVLDSTKAAPILARLRRTSGPKHAPAPPVGVATSSVAVAVSNGSGRGGIATTTLDTLGRFGFNTVLPATNADRDNYDVTEVRYSGDAKIKARLVLAYLGGAGKLVETKTPNENADVTVVIGRDFSSVIAPSTQRSQTVPSTAHTATGPAQTTGTTAVPLPAVGC